MSRVSSSPVFVAEVVKTFVVAKIESLDDNVATLMRTATHLQDNEVDLDKYPMALGAYLEFDPEKEVFTNVPDANSLLGREYRAGYECPTAENV